MNQESAVREKNLRAMSARKLFDEYAAELEAHAPPHVLNVLLRKCFERVWGRLDALEWEGAPDA